jgi:hypothetical protein
MNVFEKLNEARIRFQNANVKKSGKNSYAGYTYYELADILPAINKIAQELKFSCIVNFTPDLATLDFVDCEKNEKITFTSPMSEASLKGCHAVQNLGAVETYIKRYLYQNCFEIVEADALDGTMNPNNSENPNSSEADALIKKIQARMNTFTDEQLDYANKAINARDVKKLKLIVESLK